jgi:hypothetical protein
MDPVATNAFSNPARYWKGLSKCKQWEPLEFDKNQDGGIIEDVFLQMIMLEIKNRKLKPKKIYPSVSMNKFCIRKSFYLLLTASRIVKEKCQPVRVPWGGLSEMPFLIDFWPLNTISLEF